MPLFDGKNYHSWKNKMVSHLMSTNIQVYYAVMKGFSSLELKEKMTKDEVKIVETDAKARTILVTSLSEKEFQKVIDCSTAKAIWDNLKSIYEGDKSYKSIVQSSRTCTWVMTG